MGNRWVFRFVCILSIECILGAGKKEFGKESRRGERKAGRRGAEGPW